MTQIKCKLLCNSLSPHVQQLYTGFSMLEENGLIQLSQNISTNCAFNKKIIRSEKHLAQPNLVVEISSESNNKSILYFDNRDSAKIDGKYLQNCDIYFKRSYSQQYINKSHYKNKNKIHPLGLNYQVFPNRANILTLQRSVTLSKSVRETLRGVMSCVDTKNKVKFYPRLRELHSLPQFTLEPKVLFMVTAYDPYDNPNRPKIKIEERAFNNDFRAKCIRLLRKELDTAFYGGFIHNKYTINNYNNVLIDNPKNTNKQNYLKILNQFPICIATTGLHGSIGWKLAEYVAFSKSILSEKIDHVIPGDFKPEHNYLEFSTPENCVEQSLKLLADQELRNKLMLNNSTYYQRYVKPDMLVLNALSIAINQWA